MISSASRMILESRLFHLSSCQERRQDRGGEDAGLSGSPAYGPLFSTLSSNGSTWSPCCKAVADTVVLQSGPTAEEAKSWKIYEGRLTASDDYDVTLPLVQVSTNADICLELTVCDSLLPHRDSRRSIEIEESQ